MCDFSNKVRNKLFSIISEMNKVSWIFAKNPGHDFTRKSPLSFETMLLKFSEQKTEETVECKKIITILKADEGYLYCIGYS